MPIRSEPNARPASAAPLPAANAAPGLVASAQDSARPVARPVSAGRPAAQHAPRRPDPTSARLAVAAGGIATLSALLAAIATAAVPAASVGAAPTPDTAAAAAPVQTIVKYVYVQPGQPAPTAAPAVVVPAPTARPRPAAVLTSQSGAKR